MPLHPEFSWAFQKLVCHLNGWSSLCNRHRRPKRLKPQENTLLEELATDCATRPLLDPGTHRAIKTVIGPGNVGVKRPEGQDVPTCYRSKSRGGCLFQTAPNFMEGVKYAKLSSRQACRESTYARKCMKMSDFGEVVRPDK